MAERTPEDTPAPEGTGDPASLEEFIALAQDAADHPYVPGRLIGRRRSFGWTPDIPSESLDRGTRRALLVVFVALLAAGLVFLGFRSPRTLLVVLVAPPAVLLLLGLGLLLSKVIVDLQRRSGP